MYIGEFGDVGNGSCSDYNTKLLLYSFLVVVLVVVVVVAFFFGARTLLTIGLPV